MAELPLCNASFLPSGTVPNSPIHSLCNRYFDRTKFVPWDELFAVAQEQPILNALSTMEQY